MPDCTSAGSDGGLVAMPPVPTDDGGFAVVNPHPNKDQGRWDTPPALFLSAAYSFTGAPIDQTWPNGSTTCP